MRTGTVVEWSKGVGKICDAAQGFRVSVHWAVVDPRDREPERTLSVGDRVEYELAYGASGNAASAVRRLEP
jgi:cold shock CspA family protein